ncbi:MAG: serine/threonine protein kinase [Chloroflexi bacterium]|nr:serine/threonine protein kinase [Chloroflexota bacterium]
MIGTTLGGYKLIELIGKGGMAHVYKASDPTVKRHVAIKVLLPDYADDEEFRARFDREAETIARLEHLHILPLHAYGEQDGTLYLVMRYMPHGTLNDLIKAGPMNLQDAARILAQLASALDYAHQFGVLHRDMKPANVLLDGDRNIYLTDFGLAKSVSPDETSMTGQFIVGTPHYMSPEQCRAQDLTPAADQYGLAAMLYYMVTGQVPFNGKNALAIMRQQILDEPKPPVDLRPDMPKAASDAIVKSLHKEPSGRYPSCTALAVAFSQAVDPQVRSKIDNSSVPRQLRNRITDALSSFDDDSDNDNDDPTKARRTQVSER